MTSDIQYLPVLFLAPYSFSLGKISAHILSPCLHWIPVLLSQKCSLRILDKTSISDVWFGNVSSASVGCPFPSRQELGVNVPPRVQFSVLIGRGGNRSSGAGHGTVT